MIYMVAVIKDELNSTIGFRLIDTNTRKVMNTQKDSVILALRQKKVNIENLALHGDKLVGYNGSIDRYPVINMQLQLVGSSPVVILCKTDENKFICCDYKGEIITIEEYKLMQYAVCNGIANGKIVNGHISAIEGFYETLETRHAQDKKDGVKNMQETTDVNKSALERLKEHLRNSNMFNGDSGNIKFKIKGNDIIISEVANNITEINIPEIITKIEDNVFYLCDSLKKVVIEGTIKSIGGEAFREGNKIKFHVRNNETLEILMRHGILREQIVVK